VDSIAIAPTGVLAAFCTDCFAPTPPEAEICPSCGARLPAPSEDQRGAILVAALDHPLAEVRGRAIILLGMHGDDAVADALAGCALRYRADVVAALNVVRGLRGMRGGARSLRALHRLYEGHPAAAVREAARAAIVHRTLAGG